MLYSEGSVGLSAFLRQVGISWLNFDTPYALRSDDPASSSNENLLSASPPPASSASTHLPARVRAYAASPPTAPSPTMQTSTSRSIFTSLLPSSNHPIPAAVPVSQWYTGFMQHEERDVLNVTVSLPRSVVQKARHAAVDRGISLSRYIAQILEREVDRSASYEASRERQMKMMREGLNLNFVPGSRDELHER